MESFYLRSHHISKYSNVTNLRFKLLNRAHKNYSHESFELRELNSSRVRDPNIVKAGYYESQNKIAIILLKNKLVRLCFLIYYPYQWLCLEHVCTGKKSRKNGVKFSSPQISIL